MKHKQPQTSLEFRVTHKKLNVENNAGTLYKVTVAYKSWLSSNFDTISISGTTFWSFGSWNGNVLS